LLASRLVAAVGKGRSHNRTKGPSRGATSVTLDLGSGPFDCAIDIRARDVLDRLDEAFFDNLAKIGKRPLSHEARETMRGWFTCYPAMAHGAQKPTDETRRRRNEMRALAKRARRMASEIECVGEAHRPDRLVDHLPPALRDHPETVILLESLQPFSRPLELALALHQFANEAEMVAFEPPRPLGNRERMEDDVLIRFLAEVFHRVGGRIAVSETGPFAEFLRAVWQVLPDDVRGKSAETFVRRAGSMIGDLKNRMRDLPRNLVAGRS
jgi:hypothetical protein